MTPNRVPPIPREILEYLERIFPDKAPDLSDSDREVWAKAGEQRVIRKLRAEFSIQNQLV